MRPIVSDPNKFGGALHFEGTSITIDEVQNYWAAPGVSAVDIRRRFPELSEAELGAAVTYRPPHEPRFLFVAESDGPPRRRLHIWSELQGWGFAVDEIGADGEEHPGRDTWEETWERILLYPPENAPNDIVWRDARSGEIVDIYAMSPDRREG